MNDIQTSPAASERVTITPVVERLSADLLTPLAVYLKLSAGGEKSFLLESVEGGKSLARYSFIGAGPEFILAGNDEAVTISRTAGPDEEIGTGVIEFLRDHFSTGSFQMPAELPPFGGGGIGYLGFRCAEWFEPSLKRPSAERTDCELMFFRSVVAFDHAKQVITIISLVFADTHLPESDTVELHRKAAARNQEIREVLESSSLHIPVNTSRAIDASVTSNWTRDAFEGAVDEIKEQIAAGECYQVVLSQRFSRETNASAVAVYRALRSLNPSPYMFLLNFGSKAVVGASPEMLVRCEGKRLEYRPIAGTRARGATTTEDGRLAEDMKADKKEVAEHLMLVDLGRNDLGRIAKFGSVKVDQLMSVEKYSHVQHLVSSLSAELGDESDRFDALAACFPAGTVSGAPKVRAMEIIRSMEPTERGIYSGAVGYFDYSGNMDTCIAIRTLLLEDGVAHVQAGAGIVADSVPASEYDETVNKARGLIKAIEMAEATSN